MDSYDNIAVVGEGSYGLVMKCRHRDSGTYVAIKQFIETEDDIIIHRMALREIRMLKRLQHENLITMIEVFRKKKRHYLVFEHMEHSLLDEIREHPSGLDEETCRSHTFQILRGIDFCHAWNVVHRDVKPENILVSTRGVVKLCDFGFARFVAPQANDAYTDYVATRWYRAPELLVGDTRYGREVDIWAVGCVFAELMSGRPLFPGESDVEQLFFICRDLGRLAPQHMQLIAHNPEFKRLRRSIEDSAQAIAMIFPEWSSKAVAFAASCLRMDPRERLSAAELVHSHPYFIHDNFAGRFVRKLRGKVKQEFISNPLLRRHLSVVLLATAVPTRRKPRPTISETIASPMLMEVAAAIAKAKEEGTTERRTILHPPRWRHIEQPQHSSQRSPSPLMNAPSGAGSRCDSRDETAAAAAQVTSRAGDRQRPSVPKVENQPSHHQHQLQGIQLLPMTQVMFASFPHTPSSRTASQLRERTAAPRTRAPTPQQPPPSRRGPSQKQRLSPLINPYFNERTSRNQNNRPVFPENSSRLGQRPPRVPSEVEQRPRSRLQGTPMLPVRQPFPSRYPVLPPLTTRTQGPANKEQNNQPLPEPTRQTQPLNPKAALPPLRARSQRRSDEAVGEYGGGREDSKCRPPCNLPGTNKGRPLMNSPLPDRRAGPSVRQAVIDHERQLAARRPKGPQAPFKPNKPASSGCLLEAARLPYFESRSHEEPPMPPTAPLPYRTRQLATTRDPGRTKGSQFKKKEV